MELTPDHKPNLPGERKRIEDSGGMVVFDGFYNHRVFKKGTCYPGLNMSRAMGDVIGNKQAGISAVPDVKCINLKEQAAKGGYEFLALLLCSDGVWEFIDNNEAAKMVLSCRKEGDTDSRLKNARHAVSGPINGSAAAEMGALDERYRWRDFGRHLCAGAAAGLSVSSSKLDQ